MTWLDLGQTLTQGRKDKDNMQAAMRAIDAWKIAQNLDKSTLHNQGTANVIDQFITALPRDVSHHDISLSIAEDFIKGKKSGNIMSLR